MAKDPQTLSTLAVRLLRERIISGQLPPGAKLSDFVLSREIGISRTPIREAIRMLAADGLVEVVPHQGATVRSPNAAELDELYEIRAVLEAHAASRAAERRTSGQAAGLLALVSDMEAIPVPAGERLDAAATARQRELDLGFHRQILLLSGLTRLQRMVEDAGIIARPFEIMDPSMEASDLRSACRHHRAIAQAIVDGDAAAAHAAMTAHITAGRTSAQAQIEHWQRSRTSELPAALRPFVG